MSWDFPGKYVTLPSGQVKSVGEERGSVSVLLQLPEGREFTFAVLGEPRLQPTGAGLTISGLRQQGGLTNIDFRVESAACTLHLARTA